MIILDTVPCDLTVEGILYFFERQVNWFFSFASEVLIENPGEFSNVEESFLELGRELAGCLTAAILSSPEVADDGHVGEGSVGLMACFRNPVTTCTIRFPPWDLIRIKGGDRSWGRQNIIKRRRYFLIIFKRFIARNNTSDGLR